MKFQTESGAAYEMQDFEPCISGIHSATLFRVADHDVLNVTTGESLQFTSRNILFKEMPTVGQQFLYARPDDGDESWSITSQVVSVEEPESVEE